MSGDDDPSSLDPPNNVGVADAVGGDTLFIGTGPTAWCLNEKMPFDPGFVKVIVTEKPLVDDDYVCQLETEPPVR
jgi:hypothetical protein